MMKRRRGKVSIAEKDGVGPGGLLWHKHTSTHSPLDSPRKIISFHKTKQQKQSKCKRNYILIKLSWKLLDKLFDKK